MSNFSILNIPQCLGGSTMVAIDQEVYLLLFDPDNTLNSSYLIRHDESKRLELVPDYSIVTNKVPMDDLPQRLKLNVEGINYSFIIDIVNGRLIYQSVVV
jgi:hypothetical protein